jgi:hypothetical protein
MAENSPLLKKYMKKYPKATREKVLTAFKQLNGNFEFGTWVTIDSEDIKQIHEDAKRLQIAIWRNTDKTSSFLYGTTDADGERIKTIMDWIARIAVSGKETVSRTKETYIIPKIGN